MADADSLTLGSVTAGGLLSATVDASDDGTETLTASAAIGAGTSVTLSGSGAFNDIVDIDADITAGTSLTVQDAASVLIDASGARALTANGGDVSLATNVTGITLDGGSSTVTLDANGGSVNLAALSDDGVGGNAASLTVTADGTASFDTIDLGDMTDGALSITVDTDDNGTETLAMNGSVTNVASLTLSGGTTADDTLDINANLTTTNGALVLENAGTVDIAGGLVLDAQGGLLDLNNNVGTVSLTGAGGVALQTSTTGNSHDIELGTTTGTQSLTLSATGSIDVTGAIDVGANALSATIDSDADGTEMLEVDQTLTSNDIDLIGNASDTVQVTTAQANTNATGAFTISGAAADIDASISSGGALTITGNTLTIGNGLSLTAGGALDLDGATGIVLEGSGTATLSADGDNDVLLAGVTTDGNGSGLTVNAEGSVTGSTVSLAGATDGSLTVTADDDANGTTETLTLGTVTAVTNVALTNNADGITLPAITASATLDVTTTETITQSGALVITGASTLNAGGTSTATQDITLGHAGNDFAGVTITGGDVTLTDANLLTFDGTSTIGGTLDLTTVGVTDTAASTLTVTGAANIDSATGAITLDDGHDFQAGVTLNTSSNATINDTSGFRFAGTSTADGFAVGDCGRHHHEREQRHPFGGCDDIECGHERHHARHPDNRYLRLHQSGLDRWGSDDRGGWCDEPAGRDGR
ncbi:MAG: hypothetical protein U5O39_19000 [Gammaproteobacteria bacterium]|nr:hypothetical protein [Gammaproteobacteria bacterium]